MTFTYLSYHNGCVCTATLTTEQYNTLVADYNRLSDVTKKLFDTVDDFIEMVLSMNA